MHVLDAGPADGPLVLLLHGFPELAYSWRRIIPPLAAAGFRVIAPDQRGYGRTTGWTDDPAACSLLNLLRDTLSLVESLGRSRVETVVGHDFGASVAAMCALARPDIFRSVVLMSAPFGGPPAMRAPPPSRAFLDNLAALDPPRKHYHWYYSTTPANTDMHHAPQGLHAFLRAYFHHKSADWPGNRPHPLATWSAPELAKLPTYYVMNLHETMAQTVAPHMPTPSEIAANRWLPDPELAIYAAEYARTGFAGGLAWYRARTAGLHAQDLSTFAGRTIDIPAAFVAGRQDWGVHQKPGDFEAMQRVCTRMDPPHLLDGAGHWVQQEQPDAVASLLVRFATTHA